MLIVAYYSLFLVMGVVYADKLFKEKTTYFKLWSGGVIANIFLMCGIIPFALAFGFTKLAHILLAVFAVVPYLFMKKDFSLKLQKPDIWVFLWGFCICAVIFLIFENHVLVPVKDGFATGQSTYGDTAMHLGFISSIAEKKAFPPEFNLLSGHRLCYPFLVDSLSSSLYIFGLDLRTSLMLPSLVISLLCVMGFYYFAESLIGRKAAILAMLLFFFGGGFGFIYFLDGVLENLEIFTGIFTDFYRTPTNFVEKNIRWVNPICDMIIPQRTTMAGWCVILFALRLLVEGVRKEKTAYFVILGLVAGCMPMIHTHSFLALFMISAGCVFAFYTDAKSKKRYILNFGVYAGIAFVIAIGQLIFWTLSQSVGNSQFLRLGFNWVNDKDTYLWFWLKNWGITALFIIPAWLSQNKFNKKLSAGFIAVFALAELVIFQPNEYDNNKLFFVAYMLFVCFVSGWLVSVYDKLKCIRGRCVMAGVVLFLGMFSGVLSIIREIKSGGEYLFFTDGDMEFADFVRENTDKDAVFITGTDHINPVAVIAGRTVYAGSELYVYFHGYGEEMYKRYDILEKIYKSQNLDEFYENLSLAGVGDYILLTDRERIAYGVCEDVFSRLSCVYDKDGIMLYSIENFN